MRFRDKKLAAYYAGTGPRPRGLSHDVARRLVIKLDLLSSAESLDDLRIPPSNRLEKLMGNRRGRYSIRVTDQWRIVFTWTSEGADDVEFIDYH